MTETLFPVAASDVALTSDEWYTPRWLFKAAGITFDLDVCAPVDPLRRNCPARAYLTAVDEGLTAAWSGVIWCNPPYSCPAPWVDRFITHTDGLMLVPAARSAWRGRLLAATDTLALIDATFERPAGVSSFPYAMILAARGSTCSNAVERVAAVDPYAGGATFVKAETPRSLVTGGQPGL